MSELDAANAAPPASDSERKTALGWTALVIVLGIVAVVVALWYFYQQGKKHDEQVTAIQSAPVVLPPVVKPPIYKRIIKPAANNIADKATNTPATSEFVSEVKAVKPVEIAKVKQSSQEHKSDEAPIDLPLRPIPPIPPQRSIP